MGSALQVLEGVLQEIQWLQFKMLLLLPEVTACKQKSENGIPVLSWGLLVIIWCVSCGLSWCRSKQALPLPCHCRWGEQQAVPKLLTPVNISQAICFPLSTGREQGWHAKAFVEMQCSTRVWQPSWYACIWLCNVCMESGGKETWNLHKDKALCGGYWPVGSWGYGHTFPQHSTIGELKEWEDAVKTPVPKEYKGVLDSQGCLMLVAGSQNTGHRAKGKLILGSTPMGGVLSTPPTGGRNQKSMINHSSAESWESLQGSPRVSRSLLLPEKKHISCIYKPIVKVTFHSLLISQTVSKL